MSSFFYVFCLLIFIFVYKVASSDSLFAKEPSTCKVNNHALPMNELKDHIFCDYEPAIRSKKQGHNTTVNILLIPKTMNYDSGLNKFTLNSMLKVEWIDEHLQWNPDDFGKISEIHVRDDEIWIPDLSIWNSADTNSVMIFAEGKSISCLVMYTGNVVCVPLIETTVHCSSDFENWPFEIQICKIIFSSYFHFNEEISLEYNEVIKDNLLPSQEWNIVNTTVSSRLDLFILPRIIYEFHLKRHSRVMLILYVIPLIGLVLLTLTALVMDANSVERMSLLGLNFLSHLLCFYDLHWQVSENGNQIPRLVACYKTSLLLTGFSIILTAALRKLNTMTSSSKWISSISAFALKYRFARLFILNDEEAKCFVENEEDNTLEYVSETACKNVWKHFAKIIECLSFIIIFVTLLFTCIPM